MTARPGWLESRWMRLNGPSRIAGVDLARGLAILGMLAAHLLWIREPLALTDPFTWIAIVEGRSSILFATLAGISIALVTGARVPLAGEARQRAQLRLATRAFALWLLGLALIFTGVPVYVILPAYALLFLLATMLVPLRARSLLFVALVLAAVMPFVQVVLDALPIWTTPIGNDLSLAIGWHYPFTTWIAFVAAGMAVARAGITRLKVQGWMLVVGAALAVVAAALDAISGASGLPTSFWQALWTGEAHSTGLLEVWGSGGFAMFVIALCLLACRTVLTWVVLPLRALGAMPLTAYTVQIVAWAIAATVLLGSPGDLAAFRALEPFVPLTLGTIAGCTAWALLVGRGPLEWALDRLAKLAVPSTPNDAARSR
ncbi:heparan-alpha-glucosaminide N-acetyltransferase domain-containing protein [Microbacterium sp. R86528]|uniref:heparan-alpha-glucosaminide N-acetyltransferase domain-containing protein n=1 Tax=Microbacterium sp. R86528 TaxID=3093864 RepID=UPI0037CA8038